MTGARVLVTGGASGIGAAIVRQFAADGARVAVLDQDAEALAAAARDGPAIELGVVGEVGDPDAVDAAFAELDARWGGVDVMVNNAGISVRQPLLDTTATSSSCGPAKRCRNSAAR